MLSRLVIPLPFVAVVVALAIGATTRSGPQVPLPLPPHITILPDELPDLEPTREEILHQLDWPHSRWFADCRARDGHACCGQGGCCGVAGIRAAHDVWLGFTWVDGELEAKTIDRVLAAPALEGCYHGPLPVFDEMVDIDLAIPASGQIAVTVHNTDPGLALCVASVLRDLPFPRPAHGTATVRGYYSFGRDARL